MPVPVSSVRRPSAGPAVAAIQRLADARAGLATGAQALERCATVRLSFSPSCWTRF